MTTVGVLFLLSALAVAYGDESESPVVLTAETAALDIDDGLIGVAVFDDALGRLVALYPAGDPIDGSPSMVPEDTVPESGAQDEAFERFARDIGLHLGRRLTFDPAYDARRPHTFVVISRFGTCAVRALKVNLLDPSDSSRVMEAAEFPHASDAPPPGSILHANPTCLVRGAHLNTYVDGALTLQAVAQSAAAQGVATGSVPYELSLFISDLTEQCR